MSHYTVLAIVPPDLLAKHDGDLDSAITRIMAPYQENNMGDCPEEFLEFHDLQEKYEREWETGTRSCVRRKSDGKIFNCYDDQFYRDPTPDEVREIGPMCGTGCAKGVSYTSKDWGDGRGYRTKVKYVPDGFEEGECSFQELYDTYEDFLLEWHGAEEPDNKTGRYGYWENPNAHWDYWRIGGRWRGQLIVKRAVAATLGDLAWEHTFNGEIHEDAPNSADVALAGDIDWDAMNADALRQAENFLLDVARAKRLGVYDANGDQLVDARRRVSEMIESGQATEQDRWLDMTVHEILWALGLRHRNGHDEPFVDEPWTEEEIKTKYLWYWKFGTYAVVDPEGWYAKGEMGWWACSTDDANDREKWGREFYEHFIEPLDPETTLAILDCHT